MCLAMTYFCFHLFCMDQSTFAITINFTLTVIVTVIVIVTIAVTVIVIVIVTVTMIVNISGGANQGNIERAKNVENIAVKFRRRALTRVDTRRP